MREYSEAMEFLLKQVVISQSVEDCVKNNFAQLYNTNFVEVDGMVLWEEVLNKRWGSLERLPSWKRKYCTDMHFEPHRGIFVL